MAMSPQDEQFAQLYVKTRNIPASYRQAYGNPKTPANVAYRAFHYPKIERRVDELLSEGAASTVASVDRLARLFWDIFNADPNELIAMKVGACRYCWGEGHGYHWREREYLEALADAEARQAAKVKGVRLPEYGGGFGFSATREPHEACPECEGEGVPRVVIRDTEELSPGARLLYQGVKQTANGVQVLMADRMKALEMVGRILGAFQDKVSISGTVQHAHMVVAAIATMSPEDASKAYRDFITAELPSPASVGD